ncbi:endonuclease domain-containing 1 protein-like [Osmerus mordax]|uniref:endonuclease domain-containing 1 protein-like n=1 Tax=Osmerus mordax TaxID=8014 RepID=UPI0035101A58
MLLPASRGALLLLLAGLGGLSLGEVGDFSPCLQSFYKGVPPLGVGSEGYQPICQRYLNQYHFASLYQRQQRVPLYSAYVFTNGDGKRPKSNWMYEPQLAFTGASPEMKHFPRKKPVDQNVVESQAVLQDYTNSSYTRGHLNPSQHHQNQEDRKATFTLTNVVPQRKGSNSGPWAQLESEVKARLGAYCAGPAYVITGAVPYVTERWMNQRVAVPEYMWSAYCCPVHDASLPASLASFFPTHAAVGRNDKQSGGEIVPVDPKAKGPSLGYDVRRLSLDTLEDILRQRLSISIHLFTQQCLGEE